MNDATVWRRILLNPGILLIAVNLSWVAVVLVFPYATDLMREDGVVEWLQVIFLALAALYCARIAWRGESRLIRYGFLALGVLAAFVMLEELNWGQRILNLPTPDSVKEWNSQRQLSIHNHVAFESYLHWLPFLLCGIAGLAAIQFGPMLNRKTNNSLAFFLPPSSFRLCFILLLISGSTIGIAQLAFEESLLSLFWWEHIEFNELGIAFTTFSYAYTRYLLLARPVEPPGGRACWQSTRRERGRLFVATLAILLPCWLLSMVGLAAYDIIAVERLGEPIIRSNYEVYIEDRQVILFSRKCEANDTVGRFFLHIYPVDIHDLPLGRQEYGFANTDFRFQVVWIRRGPVPLRIDGRCLIRLSLPDYAIAAVRVGQYIPGQGRLWEGEHRLATVAVR